MAYSDYGGYAFRNGKRIESRSDVVLSPKGLRSTPGQWPGWTIRKGRMGESFHVVLGDGPVFVSLYKQSSIGLHRLGETLDPTEFVVDPQSWMFNEYDDADRKVRYIDSESFSQKKALCVLNIDGVKVEIMFIERENYYVFARVTQADGVVWTGFSGYGVGAGLEHAGYGFSTPEQVRRLKEFFPVDSARRERLRRTTGFMKKESVGRLAKTLKKTKGAS